MTHGAKLAFFGVTSRYEGADTDAVYDVDLTVDAGSFLVLVGPSGCGKTTLLRTVNRLAPLTGGRIEIDGVDTATLDPVTLRRSIGYAIQAIGLFTHMSVSENIAVVPTLLGWDRPRIAARIDEMLALVRLEPARYRDRRPAQLSGGEAQRIGVARALAAHPRVLLMDEPFGALDAIVRRELQDELSHIVKTVGTTTLFVAHDVDESLRLADRIVVLNRGAIEQAASPLEILSHPQTPFVRALYAGDPAIARLRDEARTRT